ncbi:VOC family protein [Humibacter soli]
MSVRHVLAVVPVTDFDVSREWYERLLSAPATNVPMPGILAEWRVTPEGWVQVTVDDKRAGSGLLNFAVDDLSTHVSALRACGIDVDDTQKVNKGVQLAAVNDPDGNTITFIGDFREKY